MINYEDVIKKFGTPTYLYDVNTLLNRIKYLKSKFDKNINLVYALKANSFIAKEIENNIERYEICSPGEFDICNSLKIDHKKMVISGVYKDEKTIEKMISNYDDILKFTIESMNQYKLLDYLTKKYNRNIHVLIRLTSGNQFGVNENELKQIIRDNDNEKIEIDGIEYFSGTQKHSIKRINKEIDYLNEIINDIEDKLNFNIKEVEYGPGLPIFYYQDDIFNEDDFLTEVNSALGKIKNKVISLEIGRSLVASCGSYLTKVVDLKENKNGNIAIVDGGIHHLVYYGQTMAMRIPYFEVLPKRNDKIKNYNLYGSLCTINDILVKNININSLKLGDTFIFKNVGAYSVTEGISLFLSRDLPKVIICDKNKDLKMVRNIIKTSNINFPKYEEE